MSESPDSSSAQADPSQQAPASEQPSEAVAGSSAANEAGGMSTAIAPTPESTAVGTGADASDASAVAGSGVVTPSDSAAVSAPSAQASGSSSPVDGSAAGAESSPGGASSARSTSAKSHRSHSDNIKSRSATNNVGSQARGQSSRRKRMRLGDLDLANAKIGFIGAGKMAESTINGLIHYAKISPSKIHVAAPSSRNLERFKTLGCRVTKRNYDIFGRYDCDIVFLCFHGYVIKHCYKLGGGSRPHPITTNYIPHQRHPVYILSLVSGISLSQIKACLLNPESAKGYVVEIHRIMLNTAVGHGLGICAIDCEPDSKKLSPPLRQLLSSIAQLEMVPASQMDAACAVGGSGLAFAYYFIHALADGATKMGLSRAQAIRFASKTAQCAAQTMLESGKHSAELRDQVSSPSGAAIYGMHVLDKNDVASGVSAAVEAAHKRLADLANQEVDKV